MKNRIPRYPGRVTLNPVAGQANTYDLVRADQPTEEGTPLNKATLLSDATAAKLWPAGQVPENPVVDGALGRLAGGVLYEQSTLKTLGGILIQIPTSQIEGGLFDKTICTQAEFNTLVASANWLGAKRVCFVGDGGTLEFSRSNGLGIKIPPTVRQIQGTNNAKIKVANFVYNETTNRAALWYETLPIAPDYQITDITINVTTNTIGHCFANCRQLTKCTAALAAAVSSNVESTGYGFHSCTQLVNCIADIDANPTGTSTAKGYGYGFHSCTQLVNCIADIDTNYTSTGTGGGGGSGWGFHSCTQLVNCIADVEATADGSGNGSGSSTGFQGCTLLMNCTATAIGSGGGTPSHGMGYGISNCTLLTNCTGSGYGYSNYTKRGYGISDCSYINGCKGSGSMGFLGGTNTKVDTATVV